MDERKPLSEGAKYLWRLLDQYWGCGITKIELVECYHYRLDELEALYKELRSRHLVSDAHRYGTNLTVYRAEFDRKGIIDED